MHLQNKMYLENIYYKSHEKKKILIFSCTVEIPGQQTTRGPEGQNQPFPQQEKVNHNGFTSLSPIWGRPRFCGSYWGWELFNKTSLSLSWNCPTWCWELNSKGLHYVTLRHYFLSSCTLQLSSFLICELHTTNYPSAKSLLHRKPSSAASL